MLKVKVNDIDIEVEEIKMYNNEKITCISRLTMAILKK